MSPDANVLGVSVVSAWARIATSALRPCRRANSSLHSTAAAAPQVGGQHWSLVSGP